MTEALTSWVTELRPEALQTTSVSFGLSVPDRDVLRVAIASAPCHVLSDDVRLRRDAGRLGLKCLGSCDLLLVLKRRGLVGPLWPIMQRMEAAGFGIDPGLLRRTLEAAGEAPEQ